MSFPCKPTTSSQTEALLLSRCILENMFADGTSLLSQKFQTSLTSVEPRHDSGIALADDQAYIDFFLSLNACKYLYFPCGVATLIASPKVSSMSLKLNSCKLCSFILRASQKLLSERIATKACSHRRRCSKS